HTSRAVGFDAARASPGSYSQLSSNVGLADGSVTTLSLMDYLREADPRQYGIPNYSGGPTRLWCIPQSMSTDGQNVPGTNPYPTPSW
ncbi:MAG: hypothetical protein ACHRHE_14560, partial [Tepidisphaerales bacterium]